MDWQHTLARIYLFVCKRYQGNGLWTGTQRQSNNSESTFTDVDFSHD